MKMSKFVKSGLMLIYVDVGGGAKNETNFCFCHKCFQILLGLNGRKDIGMPKTKIKSLS